MSPELPAIHIFEPSHLGHRPFFLLWLLSDPPLTRRWVLHTTPAVIAHPILAPLLRSPPANLALVRLCSPHQQLGNGSVISLLVRQLTTAITYHRSWRRYARAGDSAFIPYYDDLSLALAVMPWLTQGMPLVTIGMRAQFHQRRQGIASAGHQRGHGLKEFLLRRLLKRRTARCYLTNQLPLKHEVDAHWGRLAKKVRFYPDPAERPVAVGKQNARRCLGLPHDRRYVLCYGSLTLRKGVGNLLEALEAPDWPQEASAIFAGAYRDEVETLLSSPRAEALAARGVLRCYRGLVDQERENLLFQASDAVWVVYDGHDFMSGCLVQAGMHQRPVIGCVTGLIAWYITTFSAGLLYDSRPQHRDASLRHLASLLRDEDRLAAEGAALGHAFARHSREDFRMAVYAAILGMADPVVGKLPLAHRRPGGDLDEAQLPQLGSGTLGEAQLAVADGDGIGHVQPACSGSR